VSLGSEVQHCVVAWDDSGQDLSVADVAATESQAVALGNGFQAGEPMNPAPPVTRIFMSSFALAVISEETVRSAQGTRGAGAISTSRPIERGPVPRTPDTCVLGR
jgi:hypothetical protein